MSEYICKCMLLLKKTLYIACEILKTLQSGKTNIWWFLLQGCWSVEHVEQYLGTDELPKNDLITYLQKNADSAFLRHWKLTGTNKSIRKNRNCSQLIAAYKVYVCIQTFFIMNGCVLCFAALKILVEGEPWYLQGS